jgi:hypothetical protein
MSKLWVLLIILLSGCAGLGLEKRATLTPDELMVFVDSNPSSDWDITEVTGGLKWRLK